MDRSLLALMGRDKPSTHVDISQNTSKFGRPHMQPDPVLSPFQTLPDTPLVLPSSASLGWGYDAALTIWDFNSFCICWQRATELYALCFLSRGLREIIRTFIFAFRKQSIHELGTKKLWIIEMSIPQEAKYYISCSSKKMSFV